jgi:hypothetical protein
MLESVTAAVAAHAEKALYHLEQAPDPCHTCGGKSSITTASSAHGESPLLKPPLLNVSAHRCAIINTSVVSDATAEVNGKASMVAAVKMLRKIFSQSMRSNGLAERPADADRYATRAHNIPRCSRRNLSHASRPLQRLLAVARWNAMPRTHGGGQTTRDTASGSMVSPITRRGSPGVAT